MVFKVVQSFVIKLNSKLIKYFKLIFRTFFEC